MEKFIYKFLKEKYFAILLLTICLLTGCAGEKVPTATPDTTDLPNWMEENLSTETQTEPSSDQETTSESESSSEPEISELPELTEWDGTGEFKRLNQIGLSDFQYIDGVLYTPGRLPLLERTSGEYPGQARADLFCIVDDMIYYLEDDGTVYDEHDRGLRYRLYAQPFDGSAEAVLLAEHVFEAKYQEGILLCQAYDPTTDHVIYKQIDAESGEILLEFDSNIIRETIGNYFIISDELDYLICYFYNTIQLVQYRYEDQTVQQLPITKEYGDRVFSWAGNLFTWHWNEDRTVSLIQLYEQGEPVMRLFPVKFPNKNYSFSNGKVIYCEENSTVMEYDLASNTTRKVCDLDPGISEEKPHIFLNAQSDNGGVLLEESCGDYSFLYLIDENGKKTLLRTWESW